MKTPIIIEYMRSLVEMVDVSKFTMKELISEDRLSGYIFFNTSNGSALEKAVLVILSRFCPRSNEEPNNKLTTLSPVSQIKVNKDIQT